MIRAGVVLAGRYEVQERIGLGGMAEVYKGKDLKLNRFIAIKILRKEYREDESFVRKFQREAQAAAGLMHPNVVNVYDVGEDRGLYFMVMELVEGITLKEYIEKKGVLSANETISIAIQIASGIQAAHQKHIIHRDIKPQNVIISKEGKVKVTDFGIAKAATSNTISSNAMGSVHYTSPEQARGGFSDEKSDVYSTGITMYEMVTGRVPFDGDSTVSIAIKHLQEEIMPPSEYIPEIPYSLEQIILKCTKKNPDKRYPDMGTLIADLKRSLADPNGDFVDNDNYMRNDETVMVTPGELRQIRRQADDYDDDYDDYDEDDYDDEDYEDENEEEYSKNSKRGKKNSDVDPKMAKIMKIMKIVVGVIVALVIVFAVGKAAGILKIGSGTDQEDKKSTVSVPDVRGETYADAEKILKKKGLKIKKAGEEASDEYEKGEIISQDPGPSKKAEVDSTVEVIVSTGEEEEEELRIPSVAGETEDDAMEILVDAGFSSSNITPSTQSSDEVPAGKVIGTNPKEGSGVSADTQITLYVSSGPKEKMTTVPNVVGKSQSEATKMLKDSGLNVGSITSEYDSSKKAGTVIRQGYSSGTSVKEGTSVDLVISKGEEKAIMPDIIGSTQSSAKDALEAAGLRLGNVTSEFSDQEAGTVIRAAYGEGTELSEGTAVDIVISKGPQSGQDPDTPAQPGDDGTQNQ